MSKGLYEAPSVEVLELWPSGEIATNPPVSMGFPGINLEEDI